MVVLRDQGPSSPWRWTRVHSPPWKLLVQLEQSTQPVHQTIATGFWHGPLSIIGDIFWFVTKGNNSSHLTYLDVGIPVSLTCKRPPVWCCTCASCKIIFQQFFIRKMSFNTKHHLWVLFRLHSLPTSVHDTSCNWPPTSLIPWTPLGRNYVIPSKW